MKYYVVDAFTDKPFGGNPAGVCMLETWLPDDVLQNIASENNLSETAFVVKRDGYYGLRWFTPEMEVDLCGHATLASAYVLYKNGGQSSPLVFKTLSGELTVTRENEYLYLNLPAWHVKEYPILPEFETALGVKPQAIYHYKDYLVLFDNEQIIRKIKPDFNILKKLPPDGLGIIITAKGTDCDFVSRFFAPEAGINEDSVTGRAHCSLTPFWSEKLNKHKMTAKQLSKRGGFLLCENHGERVRIGGKAVLYLQGDIEVNL